MIDPGPPVATVVYDAGPDAGLGHRSRTAVLAHALRRAGWSVEQRPLPPSLDRPVVGDLVVVDSYRHRADDPAVVEAATVVALDDLARDLAVDLVVDPSPGADPAAHRAAGTTLAGASHALVDPALAASSATDPSAPVARVLVTVGGHDPSGRAGAVAAAVAHRLGPAIEVGQVVGPWAAPDEHPDAAPGVVPVRTDGGLGPHLARADLVVTAGGVTLLEALALGRPTIVLVVAENQRTAAQAAVEAGAAVRADADRPAEVAEAAARLAGDPEDRARLAAAARHLVDLGGADRVVEAIGRIATRPPVAPR